MATATDKSGWLPYAGFALAVAGIVYQGGGMTRDLEQLRLNGERRETRIIDIERQKQVEHREILDRLTRIEAQLENGNNQRRQRQ